MKPRAVLFDFDGTLADSYNAITASVNHVRGLYSLPPLDVSEVRRHVGRGPDHLIQATVPQADVVTAVTVYRQHHPSVMRTGTRLLPGVAEVLPALFQRGLQLGVCSNKPRAFTVELLNYLDLSPFIKVVVGPEDAPRPKPEPDMLQLALKRLSVTPAEALYVGDMAVDVTTARAAGVRVWVIATGSDELTTLQAARPDHVMNDFRDLLML